MGLIFFDKYSVLWITLSQISRFAGYQYTLAKLLITNDEGGK